MANQIKNLRYDVASRIGDKWNPGQILRAMNSVYNRLNEELQCLEKTLTIPAATFSDVIKTYAIPSDLIKELYVMPTDQTHGRLVYVDKEEWDEDYYLSSDVYTKFGGNFVFGNVGELSAFSIPYYSYGLTLVDADTVGAGEVNTPEWRQTFWWLLVYETCFELSADYPLMNNDMVHASELRSNLSRANKNQQAGTPNIIGGYGLGSRSNDPNYVDGLWVTRSKI